MRLFTSFIVVLILVTGCNSARKSFEKKNYDLAIQKSMKKLQKNVGDLEHLKILEEAFNAAKLVDKNQISYLEAQKKEENSSELYRLYNGLKKRQHLVSSAAALPNGIEFENYDEKILEAKSGAAKYHYAKGNQLLLSESHFDARDAYYEFSTVKEYYDQYEELDEKLREAKERGVSYVRVEIVNNDAMHELPSEVLEKAKSLPVEMFNTDWIKYSNAVLELDYYYTIRANILSIITSPERIKERRYTENKKIKDGWEYRKDENGKELKDSLGNKIKIDQFKTIYCNIREETRTKKSAISGQIEYFIKGESEPVKRIDFSCEGNFMQVIAYANGDMDALTPQTRQNIGVRELPFPSENELLILAADGLEERILKAISDNTILIK